MQTYAQALYPTYAHEKQFFGDAWRIAGGPVKIPVVLKTRHLPTPAAAAGYAWVDDSSSSESDSDATTGAGGGVTGDFLRGGKRIDRLDPLDMERRLHDTRGGGRAVGMAGRPVDWTKAAETYEFDEGDDDVTKLITSESLRELAKIYNATSKRSEHDRFIHTAHALKRMSTIISQMRTHVLEYDGGEVTKARRQVFKTELEQILTSPTKDNDSRVQRRLAKMNATLAENIDRQGDENSIPLGTTFLQLATGLRDATIAYMQSPKAQAVVSYNGTDFDDAVTPKYNAFTVQSLAHTKGEIERLIGEATKKPLSVRYGAMLWSLINLAGQLTTDHALVAQTLRDLEESTTRSPAPL